MAIPLKRFTSVCAQASIRRGTITESSSPNAMLYEISRRWRDLYNATNYKNTEFEKWSEKEVSAAEIAIAVFAYLDRIKCKDAEKLIRDVLDKYR